MKKITLLLALALLASQFTLAQKPKQRNAAEIELGLKKLNFLGTVLYVAAHPDDENTRLIAFLSNEILANTAYLSMTRGDGGQNLIGPEIREYLGIIRTQELLAARRVDGGRQFFTRANDFGYSKSPDETQEIWEREEVLSDVVWTFRKFRPDVIITRFPTNGGGGHGHHTTSAILAQEAFGISGDKTKFSDQLQFADAWSPKRLYLNTGRWWNQNINGDTPGVITYEVGKYNSLLGTSYTEIAAVSRTAHKSQGFGSTGTRGAQEEFLEHRLGDQAENDIFEGVNTSWSRVTGGEKIGAMVKNVINKYDPSSPGEIVSDLLEIRNAISGITDEYWKSIKTREVESLIKDCLGLYIESTTQSYSSIPGAPVNIRIEAINRSGQKVQLNKVSIADIAETTPNKELLKNTSVIVSLSGQIPQGIKNSQPYWLVEKGSLGMYSVSDQELIGMPENDPSILASYEIEIEGETVKFTTPLVFKWNDPVMGELYRPFVITPRAFLNLANSVYVFASDEPKEVELVVKSGQDNLKGNVSLEVPKGWKIQPQSIRVEMASKGEEQRVKFSVLPPAENSEGSLKAVMTVDGFKQKQTTGLVEIKYDHIPTQTIFPESKAKVVKLNLEKKGSIIGYIHGAGDDIPQSLRDMGYEVWEMNDSEITPENLERLDAVVLGVRALNTRERLKHVMDDLLSYAEEGGTLVVQYNTSRRTVTTEFSPYALQLSRGRVSLEDAQVRILTPNHPVIAGPNKITSADFDGWVQERGLYFPSQWGSEFTPILSSNDPGEDPLDGGLLVADYGKGKYIYTGYSWFRQLPAGVPGAIKLFANIVSLGNKEVKDTKIEKY